MRLEVIVAKRVSSRIRLGLGKNYNKMVPSWFEIQEGESGKQLRWFNRSKNFFYYSRSNK